MRLSSRWRLALSLGAGLLTCNTAQARAESERHVDTALVVSVDVSNSVDEYRYRLQMEGIAAALEDQGVIDAITNGPNGAILISMVTWADTPDFTLPWMRISNKEEAAAVAAKIRRLPHQGGQFTCMTRMLRSVNDKIISQIPAEAVRVVVDVSGDGPENCNSEEPIEAVRDELVSYGVTVNGLPIIVGNHPEPAGASAYGAPGEKSEEAAPKSAPPAQVGLEEWFRTHVMGAMAHSSCRRTATKTLAGPSGRSSSSRSAELRRSRITAA